MRYPHYTDNGLRSAPAVVFIGSLGTTLTMWDAQIEELGRRYRTIAVDLPGHGGTPVPQTPCTVPGFAAQVLRLMDALGVARFSVVGLSFGGAVVQSLAGSHPDRIESVVIACAAPRYTAEFWHDRAEEVRKRGLTGVLQRTALRRFAPGFDLREPEAYAASLLMLATMDPLGYAACCDALATHDAGALLPRITAPTLILAGELDHVTPPALVREMHALVSDSELRLIRGCGHLANIEKPLEFNTLVDTHLANSIGSQEASFRPAERATDRHDRARA
ncbi:alpha/beta fold hydrolase [Nocardia sp. NPDC059246]|uniref:alpha/beta fold hydrolase n=1 Tax=unclassified Nocardia TaxID=2637762 RepID=UPI0036ADC86D